MTHTIKIEDLTKGTILNFHEDGEWKVVKQNTFTHMIQAIPYCKKAKSKYVSIAVDMTIHYVNKENPQIIK